MKKITLLGDNSARFRFISQLRESDCIVRGEEILLHNINKCYCIKPDDFMGVDFVIYVASDNKIDTDTQKIIEVIPEAIPIDFYDATLDGHANNFIADLIASTIDNKQKLPLMNDKPAQTNTTECFFSKFPFMMFKSIKEPTCPGSEVRNHLKL